MGGGSFNYLCRATDLEDLAKQRHDLSDMVDALAHLGYAADAAQETASLLAQIRATQARAQASAQRLADVWKAVEWCKSYDWGEERIHEALAKYRGETAAPEKTYTLTPEEAAMVDDLRAIKAT